MHRPAELDGAPQRRPQSSKRQALRSVTAGSTSCTARNGYLLPRPALYRADMSTQAFNGAYLQPLFQTIEQARGEGAYRQLPVPHPASSLAADDAPLGPYAIAHLVRNAGHRGEPDSDTPL